MEDVDGSAPQGGMIGGVMNDDASRQPDWEKISRQFEEGMAQFAKASAQAGHVLAVQGAMGWAYRGDLEKTREVLAEMSPEQVAEVSAAASLLGSVCDEELLRRGREE
ncbi:hypothetical protein ACIBCT_16355 [Streptosporangium sp. NPDC050855]|uniref:hypothetical protein n=1 Tax=Streptosporangium sp. NPDC050855 TaxID=3366194 RepID=UPI0037A62A25